MKKISFWLNIILIVAVAVLFFLHFQTNDGITTSDSKKEKEEKQKEFDSYDNLRVAYVNIDSLLNGYDMYTEKRDDFVEEQTSSQSKLQNRSQQLQQEFNELKNKVDKGMITRAKAQMMQRNLSEKEQELRQLSQNMSSELSEKEQVIYRQVLNNVMDYLDEYAEEHDYHYILSYSFGGPVLYKNDQFNITQEVLAGLNEEYDKEQQEE
ncbi:MAG: OmpH family outer membrane protein [Bacteroidota bacterium]